MTTVEVPVGARVQVAAGIGYARWTGSNPGFAPGKWVGVELDAPGGKNDGSVKGERYFECAPNHGVFVRPSQVKILEVPPGSSARSTTSTPLPPSKPPSRAVSPQKTGQNAKAGPSTPPRPFSRTPSNSQITSPPNTVRKPSTSASAAMPPPASTRPLGPSGSSRNLAGRPPSVADSARAPSPATAVDEAPAPRREVSHNRIPSIARSEARSEISTLDRPTFPRPRSVISPTPTDTADAGVAERPRHVSPAGESSVAAFAQKRELEELRIKVRLLETRKGEDQERIRILEAKVGEADTLRAARGKLQAKFQELQSSLLSAQKQSRDLQSENTQLDGRASEAMEQLEMAALDREVAEEKAELAEAEVTKLQERVEELELEVAVLKEENADYERPVGAEDAGRSSLAYIQLEKHNERLKEALMRLRDVSSETEKDQKAKIAELAKQLLGQEGLQAALELAESRLAQAESQVEDLKMQLDDALGAEDMLEQLTERNLQMGERIEEMRVTIEDLEALKELNDELEENHVEAEKQLHGEIDGFTTKLRAERTRAEELEGVVLDMETTISQFRDLVNGLQSEIDYLREQQASQENETATTSKEAQALMNLNLKLQTTASKAQSKTIDLDLKRLEAAQLAEHMKIVTAYLPDPYLETEADSTAIYLFFLRLAAKVELLINAISQSHSLPGALQSASSEALVGICELRGKLRHFASLNRRFAGVMIRGSPDAWISYGKVNADVAGVEHKVDGWISMIRQDDFKEAECARELGSLVAQFDHLGNTTFNHPALDAAERQLGEAYSFDYDLDNFAAAVGFVRYAVSSLAEDPDIKVDVGGSSLEEAVYDPVKRILDQVRSIKMPSSKLLAEVETITQTGVALNAAGGAVISELAGSVSHAVDLAVQLAQRIGGRATELRSSKGTLHLSELEGYLRQITSQAGAAEDAEPWEVLGELMTRLNTDLAAALLRVKSAAKSGQTVSMEAPPPYLARVAMIKEAAQFNADTERKVFRLSEELKDMLREVKLRDQSLQESGVKVETLERRLEASRKQADIIVELENDVAKAKKQEKVYEDAIEQLQAEQDALEAENAKLRKGQGTPPLGMQTSGSVEPLAGAPMSGLEGSQMAEQIENLRSAIRFLRSENALLKSQTLYSDLRLLPRLPVLSTPLPVPALDPSDPLGSPGGSEDGEMPVTPTKQALQLEGRVLWHEVASFQSRAKIVDISQASSGGWTSRKRTPEVQMREWKEEERRLGRKVEGLKERIAKLSQGNATGRR